MYEEELYSEDKKKFSLWLQQETFDMVEKMYHKDNCTSRSEFIEKAIKFYCGFLRNNDNSQYLSTVLMSTMQAMFKESDNRISKLIFKLAVELAITMNVVAANQGVDKEVLKSLRGECIKEVKKTNGIFTFDEADNWQRGL